MIELLNSRVQINDCTILNKTTIYEVFTVKLRIQVFWDVMLCHSGVISNVWKEFFLDPLDPSK